MKTNINCDVCSCRFNQNKCCCAEEISVCCDNCMTPNSPHETKCSSFIDKQNNR